MASRKAFGMNGKRVRKALAGNGVEISPLLTLHDVGKALGKTPRAVRHMIQRGQLPAVRLGREFRVPTAALATYMTDLPEVVPW
jgi:excisionase family DNA binding protein